MREGNMPAAYMTDEAACARARSGRPLSQTPFLRESLAAAPEEFARSTCYTAGHLTQVNAGWRSVKPVLDADLCTLCLSCYLYCPDGAVFKLRDDAGEVRSLGIDYDFCKGCGVCAKVCPADSIVMVDEHEDVAAKEGCGR